jgi:hypothetical protein
MALRARMYPISAGNSLYDFRRDSCPDPHKDVHPSSHVWGPTAPYMISPVRCYALQPSPSLYPPAIPSGSPCVPRAPAPPPHARALVGLAGYDPRGHVSLEASWTDKGDHPSPDTIGGAIPMARIFHLTSRSYSGRCRDHLMGGMISYIWLVSSSSSSSSSYRVSLW